jgi:flagellar biosynthetic protein FliP
VKVSLKLLRNKYAAITLSFLVLTLLGALPASAMAQVPALTANVNPDGSETYSLSIQTLILLTSMTFLPAALLMMTGFTRIIIVFGLLRQAIGTPTAPPNMVMIGLALFLTYFIMSPVLDEIHQKAYVPLNNGTITFEQATVEASAPLRKFMLDQTRQTDLLMFANMAGIDQVDAPENVPMRVLVPAFATSELKTAFQIGFTIFIPFLIIDLVVASVLMALGMMMVPPVTISLPFKLMLFVLADGWGLLMSSLAKSFYQ